MAGGSGNTKESGWALKDEAILERGGETKGKSVARSLLRRGGLADRSLFSEVCVSWGGKDGHAQSICM